MISRLTENDTADDRKTLVMPELRLAVAFFIIVFTALSGNFIFTVVIMAAVLVRLSLMKAEKIAVIMKMVLLPVAMTMLLTLPSVFMGHPGTMPTVTLKVLLSVLTLSELNNTMSWKSITGAFGKLHMPKMFIFTLDMTVRFLVILGRYCGEILDAVSLRSVGKTNWRNAGTGGIMGTVFLQSERMSEETAKAMTCRCFDGEYRIYS